MQYLINVLDYTGAVFNSDILELIAGYLSDGAKQTIIEHIFNYCSKRNMDFASIETCYRDGTDSADETLIDLFDKAPVRRTFQKDVIQAIKEAYPAHKGQTSPLFHRIKKLRPLFGLDDLESRILILFYLCDSDAFMNELIDALCQYLGLQTRRYEGELNELTVAVLLGERRSRVHKALNRQSTLVKTGMLTQNRDISDEIVQFLEGYNDKPILQTYFTEYDDSVIPLKDHFVNESDIRIIEKLYRRRQGGRGVNILLYGLPGTGKTAFARSLGAHLNARTYEVKHLNEGADESDGNRFRKRAFTACQNMVERNEAFIIVDEADSLLNAIPRLFMLKETTEKGHINSLLDESNTFNIWIANYVDGMDPSTRRRFDYAVKFDRMTYEQRLQLWRYKAQEYDLRAVMEDRDMARLAETYESNAGEIDAAMRNAADVFRANANRERVLETIEHIINAQQRLKGKPEKRLNKTHWIGDHYNLHGLHIDTDAETLMRRLQQFYDSNACRTFAFDMANMNLFLYGPPGTGKSAFARYLAHRLKRKLIVKSAGDILSPYVGVTEQAIRQAFEQAEQEQAMLFFDEIDSLLFSRTNANRSWEVSQVNELLAGVEQFNGVFIAATNHKELLDNAAIRRFSHKIRFDYLTPEGVLRFYRQYLAPLASTKLSRQDRRTLQRLSCLTPGDFKVDYQMHVFASGKAIGHSDLIEALEKEAAVKNDKSRRIGF